MIDVIEKDIALAHHHHQLYNHTYNVTFLKKIDPIQNFALLNIQIYNYIKSLF